jgi:hypothetical protein
MDRKKLLIIIGCVVLVLIIVGVIVLVRACSNDELVEDQQLEEDTASIDQRRLNKLKLAETYLLAGEYDMALNLINELLIENFDDEEARTLQRIILSTDRSGGQDALMDAQRRLLEEQLRQTQALVSNMNRNPVSGASGQSAADIQAAAEARRAAEAEEAARRAAEQAERQRLLDAVSASLQSSADASQGISTGTESVELPAGEFTME